MEIIDRIIKVHMKRDEILHLLAAHKQELESQGVKSLALFGSVARDEARSDSDVDILVEFSKPVGIFEFIDLKNCYENPMINRLLIKVAQASLPVRTPIIGVPPNKIFSYFLALRASGAWGITWKICWDAR